MNNSFSSRKTGKAEKQQIEQRDGEMLLCSLHQVKILTVFGWQVTVQQTGDHHRQRNGQSSPRTKVSRTVLCISEKKAEQWMTKCRLRSPEVDLYTYVRSFQILLYIYILGWRLTVYPCGLWASRSTRDRPSLRPKGSEWFCGFFLYPRHAEIPATDCRSASLRAV